VPDGENKEQQGERDEIDGVFGRQHAPADAVIVLLYAQVFDDILHAAENGQLARGIQTVIGRETGENRQQESHDRDVRQPGAENADGGIDRKEEQ